MEGINGSLKYFIPNFITKEIKVQNILVTSLCILQQLKKYIFLCSFEINLYKY